MASTTHHKTTRLELPDGSVQEVFAPEDTSYRMQNWVRTKHGSFEVVRGPCPYIPSYPAVGFPSGYSTNMRGIFHTRLANGRDVLLLHTGATLLVHQGWNNGNVATVFKTLKGSLPNQAWSQAPTQFDTDGKRVFIAMGMDQPVYCYDGRRFDLLGYRLRPPAPMLIRIIEEVGNIGSGDSQYLRHGGVRPGAWEYYQRFRDIWGDFSAESPAGVMTYDGKESGANTDSPSLVQFTSVIACSLGPDKTGGRHIYRSGDKMNQGPAEPGELYGSVGVGGDTELLPDNISTIYIDAIGDPEIGTTMARYRPVPACVLLRVAMGRLWLGNEQGDPGILYYSLPGMMGTFGLYDSLYPDPSGGALTGLARVGAGLLAMTESSVYLVYPASAGLVADAFQSKPVPGGMGCAAPSSIATMPNGLTVWLGVGGFYAYDGEKVVRVSDEIRETIERLSRGRLIAATASVEPCTGEYRCAVSTGKVSNRNDLILTWDGKNWQERTDIEAGAICVTADHRRYMLVAGREASGTDDGIWVMDHESDYVLATASQGLFWSRFHWDPLPGRVRDYKALILLFLEGSMGSVTVEFYRDGDRSVIVDSHSHTLELAPLKDSPPKWGLTKLTTDAGKWRNRKPMYVKVDDVPIPNAKSAAFKLTASGDVQFVGYAWVYKEVDPGAGVRVNV